MICVNVTTMEGELLGQFVVSNDDLVIKEEVNLMSKAWIGEQVLNQLPSDPVIFKQYLDS